MKKFILWCSGADLSILENLISEHNKYLTVGISVLISSILAFITGVYAFNSVIENPYSSNLIGLVWALVIFSINRTLLEGFTYKGERNTRSVKSFLNFIFKVIPAGIINLFIAFIISYPLVFAIFKGDISENISNTKISVYKSKNQDIDTTINEMYREIQIRYKQTDRLKEEYIREMTGEGGSGLSGYGEITKLKQNQYRESLQEYEKFRFQNEQRIRDLQKIKIVNDSLAYSEKMKIDRDNFSFSEKFAAYNQLEKNNPQATWIRQILTILFFLIEILPYVAKFFINSEVYETAVLLREDFEKNKYASDLEQKTQLNKEILLNLQKEIQNIKSHSGSTNFEKLELYVNNLSKENKEEHKSVSNLSFELYYRQIIETINASLNSNNKRAGNLLTQGLIIIFIGILMYLGLIFYWIDIFQKKGFQYYHIFGIASSSLLFLFFEFLGAWFLRQYKNISDNTLYLLKFKAIHDRYLLSYLAIKDLDTSERKGEHLIGVLDLLKSDFKFPEHIPDISSSFAKETLEAVTSLTDSVKKLTEQTKK